MLKRGMMILVLAAAVAAAFAGAGYQVEPDNAADAVTARRSARGCVTIEDGVSHIDPEVCINCGLCQGVCTYDAIH